MNWQAIITWVLFAGAAVYLARAWWPRRAGAPGAGKCGGCCGCALTADRTASCARPGAAPAAKG